MPDIPALVINTAPRIALGAALGDCSIVPMDERVLGPREVCQDILVGGPAQCAVAAFEAAHGLQKKPAPLEHSAAVLLNVLDSGAAAVIQLARNDNVRTVCRDESAGRRMARLPGLAVTGSRGVLLRARRVGDTLSRRDALQRMRHGGIWLSDRVINFALAHAGAHSDIQGA